MDGKVKWISDSVRDWVSWVDSLHHCFSYPKLYWFISSMLYCFTSLRILFTSVLHYSPSSMIRLFMFPVSLLHFSYASPLFFWSIYNVSLLLWLHSFIIPMLHCFTFMFHCFMSHTFHYLIKFMHVHWFTSHLSCFIPLHASLLHFFTQCLTDLRFSCLFYLSCFIALLNCLMDSLIASFIVSLFSFFIIAQLLS